MLLKNAEKMGETKKILLKLTDTFFLSFLVEIVSKMGRSAKKNNEIYTVENIYSLLQKIW